ncbi:thiamine pyrophosphate-dependent enzyme [Desmospora activa]|uniref:2-oxoisovalerate dehydrogenase subunit alpha n=1 Tax=Desmospora activa DSM 45169 TaxID=1121389 RepID=A0A2T4Z0V3_9BACL|nr:thiamine pyrophosphate-dependent enzyme [Desmospora activa]PTM53340.1 pyruvate dehydrogenase E1 component alpha subunit [Desmospora activa DSM 45169]
MNFVDPKVLEEHYQMYQVIDEEGKVVNEESLATFSDKQLKELMTRMVYTRAWDEKSAIFTTKEIGIHAPVSGQEASMIGSQYALGQTDWIAPTFRDIPQIMWHGFPKYKAILYQRGHFVGGQVPKDVHVLNPQIVIAAQMTQATGLGLGLKKDNNGQVVIVYGGDGSTSQGDFYEAMNFASVFGTNTIFFIQNNQYAATVKIADQTTTKTLAQKALAAGIKSIQVDGMDVLAVYKVTQKARMMAAKGEPVLIEAINYRIHAHFAGDDPSRYRLLDEIHENWLAKEPLIRYRKFLEKRNLWSTEEEKAVIKHAEYDLDQAIEKARQVPKQTIADLETIMYQSTD